MELIMFLGNDFIESVVVNTTKISEPGYLGTFKRQLKDKYWEMIQQTADRPEFLLANITTTANSFS